MSSQSQRPLNSNPDSKQFQSCCVLPPEDEPPDEVDPAYPLIKLRPLRSSKNAKHKCGYDCEFIDPPSTSLVQSECSICLMILRSPHLISCCGQNYCKDCIQQVLNNHQPCPLCKSSPFTVMHNGGLERSLLQLEVKCSNHKQGCPWTGQLRHFEEHLNVDPKPDAQLSGCKFVPVACVHSCGSWFHRGAIGKHQRDVCPQRPFCCDYCRDYTSVHADVVYRHWPVCKCYPMECPNHCSAYAIERQYLEEHLETECPLKVVECEFHNAGCEEMIAREDMGDHCMEFHLQHTSLLAAANQKLSDEVAERVEQIVQLKEEFHTELSRVKEESQQRIDNLWLENALLKEAMETLRSEMAAMRQEFSRSISDCKALQVAGDERVKNTSASLEKKVDSLKARVEKSTSTLFQQCCSIQSHVGVFPLEFIMPDYSKCLQEDREWFSPFFYSHLEGYKLCLSVMPRGRGKGNESYVTVYVCLMRGEYDNHLKWPLLAEITVQLCNQLTDRYHATGVIRFTDKTPSWFSSRVEMGERAIEGWGLQRFIAHDELGYNSVKNRQYLKDDKMCFRITKVQLTTTS